MKVQLLGTAAGGGFPQWNCGCSNCRAVRSGNPETLSRKQSCVAFSATGESWFLINASPDLAAQIESFPPLQPGPGAVRESRIDGVLLTNGDLDHTLGLFLLREGPALPVHTTVRVRSALDTGLNLTEVLNRYNSVSWIQSPETPLPLPSADGKESGLVYHCIPIPGKPPKYLDHRLEPAEGDSVVYYIEDLSTGGRLLAAPDVAVMTPDLLEKMAESSLVLFDGTFWSETEMNTSRTGAATAAQMGHIPISGTGGSLESLSRIHGTRRVYIHINNTNPILRAGSNERDQVEAAGIEVGCDGMSFEL